MHTSRMRTARLLIIPCSALGGGSAQHPWMQTPHPLDMWPVKHAGKPAPPPTPDRMTDACENINLPQTSFAGGNYTDFEVGEV